MMKNVILGILFLFGEMLFATEAFAIHKLDFTASQEAWQKKISRVKTEWQEKYGATMEKLHDKVLRSTGLEGAAVFNAFIKPNLDAAVGDTTNSFFNQVVSGKFDANELKNSATRSFEEKKSNFTSKFNSLTKSLDSAITAANTATSLLKDYDDAKLEERKNKEEEISEKLAEIKVQMADPDNSLDGKKAKELAEEAGDLEKQLEEIRLNTSLKDSEREKLSENKKESLENLSSIKNEISALQTESGASLFVAKKLQSFFDIKDENETTENTETENKDLYAAEISSLFMPKYEVNSAAAIEKVMKAREKEYYNALQNLARTVTQDAADNEIVENESRSYAEQTTKVDGLYASMSMRIGVDIQNVKLAARFTDLLLAEMRYYAIKDIMNWKKNKLRDYDTDVTRFNFDNYVLTDKEINQGFFGKSWNKVMSAKDNLIQNGLDKGYDKLDEAYEKLRSE